MTRMTISQIIQTYPLTSSQREIWFDQMLNTDLPLYNIGGYVKIPGRLDTALFEQAVNLLVQKHDALRTVLLETTDEDGVPLQAFMEHLQVSVPVQDVSAEADPHAAAMVWMQARFEQPFALTGQPLFRYDLVKLAEDSYYWLLQYHHLILDGWGVALVNRSLAAIYTALTEGEVPDLSSPSYIPFIDDDRQYVESSLFQTQRDYWLEKYSTPPEPLLTPRYHAQYAGERVGSGCETLFLSRDLYQRLGELAQRHNATLFHVLLGTLYVYFTRTAQREDFAIGLPVLNRANARFRQTAGLFVGVSPAVFQVPRDASFGELLQHISKTLKANYRHQRFPVSELNRAVGLEQGRSQLFDVNLSYEQHDYSTCFAGIDGYFTALLHPWEQTPLMIFVRDFHAQADVKFDFVFNGTYFNAEEICALQARFVTLLEAVLEQDQVALHQLPIMSSTERQQLQAWNATAVDYPQDQTIVSLFEAQVARTPDNTAVVFEGQSLTYAGLNARANQLAHVLIQHGVVADTLVGICVGRSLEMVIGLLAILKAGGAYVPLDPSYPAERLAFMVQDSQVALLLTQTHLQDNLPLAGLNPPPLLVWVDDPLLAAGQPVDNPPPRSQPQDLAYVIYTSGSTGKPKGVKVENRNVKAFLFAYTQAAPVSGFIAGSSICPFSFDVFVWECFSTLCFGHSLYVISSETIIETDKLVEYMQQHQITQSYLPPALLNAVATQFELKGRIPLQRLLVGVEPIEERVLQRFRNLSASLFIINGYGPTEATVCTTFYNFMADSSLSRNTPIGRPLANYRIYLCDANSQVVPIGVVGEICIAGAGLARGYLNRPALTAEKFVEVALFGQVERIYRTGDLARWLPDGNLEYLGRIDHQVKLRGFRIELGEVEAVLAQHPGVAAAAVVLHEREGNKSLAAYVVAATDSGTVAAGEVATDTTALRTWLAGQLPDYMVPATFTVLAQLPLTPNGKVDRKALPEPDWAGLAGQPGAGAGLRTPTEQLLATLWAGVLKLDTAALAADAQFFALGGHSLLATQLAARVRDAFAVELPLRVVFAEPTLGAMAAWLDTQQRGVAMPAMAALPAGAVPPLSFAQQRLWFLGQLEGQSATYNMPAALQLRGQLDVAALRHALQTLVARHASLRQCFPAVDGGAVVCELPAYDPLQVVELRHLPVTEQHTEVQQRADVEAAAAFDLARGPLFRAQLLVLAEDSHVLLVNMHHIISDGWSMGVLLREWNALYQEAASGIPANLPALPVQYGDYAAWQRQWLQGEVLAQQRTYWAQQLAGLPALLELPTDFPRPAVQDYRGAHVTSTLDAGLAAQLQALAQAQGCTLYMLLLAAFQTLLQRYSQQDDVCVGSPIANRTQAQAEGLIGFFVNTLVLRAHFTPALRFTGLLNQVRHTALGAYAHQDIPFEQLVEQLNPPRSLSHSPLFQVMLVLQNNEAVAPAWAGVEVTPLPAAYPVAKFDLTLSVAETPDGLDCHWEYATALFREGTIQRMAGHLDVLLRAIVAQPDAELHTLPLLTEAERQQLQAWNATDTAYPQGQTIVSLFEAQVARTPDNTAVVFEGQSLTYAVLNARANQLAHVLIQHGVVADTLVGICVGRSLEMVIGLLAILKAGGAYVPLDPSYPAERLAFMVQDSQVALLLTQTHLQGRLPLAGLNPPPLLVWVDDPLLAAGQPVDNPPPRSQPQDLAYVIYTSGSTGTPKGVSTAQHAIASHCLTMQVHCQITPADRVLQFASFNFDASVEQLFSTWFGGATLLLLADNRLTPAQLVQYLDTMQVTVADLPPAYWQQICQFTDTSYTRWQETLRLLIVGGEALPLALAQDTRRHFPSLTCMNAYGPTEASVTSTVYTLPEQPDLDTLQTVPIGQPLAGKTIHLLDAHLQPLPPGIPGELCIAGAGLARGYLNRPALTAEKFVEVELFGQVERIYRTGDLARWLPDGNLEYLGRIDHQVKLRGFRIELGEVEAVLAQHPGVAAAAVVLHEREGNKSLAAYVVAATATDSGTVAAAEVTAGSLDTTALRTWLAGQLPEYMVPASFTVLTHLPLTPNGKVDRKALPEPDSQAGLGEQFALPRSGTEQQLADIWATVLKRPLIGIHDNFFELGGDSILSIQIVARARQAGLGLNPRDVFQHQTVAALAQVVQPVSQVLAEQGLVQGEVAFTPIQARFLGSDTPEPWHFNQAMLLHVPDSLVEAALQQAFAAILAHHDALRLRYRRDTNGNWQQHHAPWLPIEQNLPFHAETLDAAAATWQVALAERCTDWQASLHLAEGPLTRLVLFRDQASGQPLRLLWVIHHLVVDGVSWRILLDDLQVAYQQATAGQAIQLPPKTSSFRAWAQQLQHWVDSAGFAADAAYWHDLPNLTNRLPLDNPQGSNRVVDTAHHTLTLDASLTRQLLEEAPAAYRTGINDLLLSALLLALHGWGGQRQYLLDLESHGRAELFAEVDTSRTVGWFTSLYTVVLGLPESAGADLGQVIRHVKEQLRQIPHEGIACGLLRLQGVTLPAASILFNYLGQFDQTAQAEGFRLASEDSGRSHSLGGSREHLLEINGLTVQGQLSLTFSYSRAQCQPATLERLAAAYQQQVQALVTHCQTHAGHSPSDFPLLALKQAQVDQLDRTYGRNLEGAYPLTPMQQGMLFHSLYAPHSGLYVEQMALHLSGGVDPARLRQAWQWLVDRHAILRSAFVADLDGQPVQVVCRQVELPWQDLDWRELPLAEQAQHRQQRLDEARQQGFALGQAPLMHCQLLRETDDTYWLLWHHHHLLLDGWCLPIVLRELFTVYSALCQQQHPNLPPLRDYRHYLAWLAQQDQAAARDYWQGKLAGFSAPTPVPWAGHAQAGATAVAAEASLMLDADLSTQCQAFARQQRVTLNTLVQAAWALLLGRYSGETDVVFGATTSGRNVPLAGIEDMVGLFINTLPLRAHLDNTTLTALLQALQAQQQADNHYAYASLADIQGWSEVPNGTALFDSIVVFENYPVDESLLQSEYLPFQVGAVEAIEQTNYLLTLAVLPGKTLGFKLSVDASRIPISTAERILGHLQTLLQGIVAQPDAELHTLPLLTEAERQQLQAWNATDTAYPQGQTIVSLFEAQVARTPDNTAVVFEDQSLTYAALNARANQLAHVLTQHGVVADTLVGICVGRSLEMVIGLLAILKAGGAYVPLDPGYPAERLAFMVQDSQVALLLTQTHLQGRLPLAGLNPPPLLVWVDDPLLVAGQPVDNPPPRSQPQDLAYVIYTSGSTGKPKGVCLQHYSLNNYLYWALNYYPIHSGRGAPVQSSLSFDATITSLYLPLLAGKTTWLIPEKQELELLAKLLEQQSGFGLLKITPSHLEALNQQLPANILCDRTHSLVLGGEALQSGHLQPWLKNAPDTHLINEYGPTEATVGCIIYDAIGQRDLHGNILIGSPIANTRIHLLDAHLQPLPPGIPGELCIAGAGLARGYLNRPALTAEKFVEVELFGQVERLYRTGDLARWLPDGNLEYLGRIDHQVKLRGFRIELGEVEAVLAQHPGVAAAAVVLHEREGNQSLAAYVVAAGADSGVAAGSLDTTALRTWLAGQLPEYMVPASFTVLAHLPLTPNGKVDRKALPEPDALISHSHAPTPPRDTLELQLLGSWEFALNRRPLGIQDDFFALGGHSLLAVRLMGHIQQQLGLKLPLGLLFQYPSVARLADYLRQQGEAVAWDNCVTIQADGEQPALFLLPGALGSVLYLQPLAALLGNTQPIYALQTPGLGGEAATPTTVDALAAYHLQAVRQRQPHGPYRLVGHSSGGRVAFALAQQLQQQGEQVSLLGILDTTAPGGASVPDQGGSDEHWLSNLVMVMEELTGLTLGVTLEGLQALTDTAAAYRVTLQAFQRQQVLFTADASVDDLRHWVTVYRASSSAHSSHQADAARLHCPIHLFRASATTQVAGEETVWEDLRPYWGWDAHTLAGVVEIPVPGTHVTMMATPHVQVLAQAIQTAMQPVKPVAELPVEEETAC